MNTTLQASPPPKTRPIKFNSLKIRALSAFENRGWINPPTWAALTRFNPVRSSYSYLLRLMRLGLLERGKNRSGLVFYRLTQHGQQRLEWLRAKKLMEEKQAKKKEAATGK